MAIAGPPEKLLANRLAIDFVVVSDRAQLGDMVQRTPADSHGNVATLDDAVAAFNPTERAKRKTIIQIRP
ncbi:hypothetical protein [Streptomyces sp. LN590]|uniref:hypothetical protein n=1 Tax=Streptomyces sp. LN590 TaxID=3112980 RepID=UPI0037111B46